MSKILIVDDSKSVHGFINMICKNELFELIHASHGDEALKILEVNSEIKLIFLDWEMPIKNGPDTLRIIKEQGIKTPVIMMTSKNKAEDIESMLREGAFDYMMKPFTQDIFLNKISGTIGE